MQVYKEINTFVALTGLEVWTDSDKITVSSAAGSTLDSFSNWRNSELVKRKKHDNAQLLRSAPLTVWKYKYSAQNCSNTYSAPICVIVFYFDIGLNQEKDY